MRVLVFSQTICENLEGAIVMMKHPLTPLIRSNASNKKSPNLKFLAVSVSLCSVFLLADPAHAQKRKVDDYGSESKEEAARRQKEDKPDEMTQTGKDELTLTGYRENTEKSPRKPPPTSYSFASAPLILPAPTPFVDTSAHDVSGDNKKETKEETEKTDCPVGIKDGKKIIRDLDYRGEGDNPLVFERVYQPGLPGGLFSERSSWHSNYDIRLRFTFSNGQVCDDLNKTGNLSTSCSANYPFTNSNISVIDLIREGVKTPMVWSASAAGWVEQNKPFSDYVLRAASANTWSLAHSGSGTVETFGSYGRITSTTNRHGIANTFTYEHSTGNKLLSVNSAGGRSLRINWINASTVATDVNIYFDWRISSITTPEGKVFEYTPTSTYCGDLSLTVTYPDGLGSMQYSCTSGTGRQIDVDGKPYKSFTLDSGRVVSSGLADGKGKSTFQYLTQADGTTQTIVTDPLGKKTTYSYRDGKITQMDRRSPDSCPSAAANYNHLAGTELLEWKEDWSGNRTSYLYYPNQRLKAEYFNGKTREYIWNDDGTLREYKLWNGALSGVTCKIGDPCLPASVAKSTQRYEYYGAEGNYRLKSYILLDEFANEAKTNYSYTFHANKYVATKTVDGPRTDVNDIEVYTYNVLGGLEAVRNAAGHETRIEYLPNNDRPYKVTDANGFVTEYEYDGRMRVKNITERGEATINASYKYNGLNQTTEITSPYGKFTNEYEGTGVLRKAYEPVSLVSPTGAAITAQWTQYDYSQNIALPTKTSVMFAQGGVNSQHAFIGSANYNSAGLANNITSPLGAYDYLYDENLNIKKTTNSAGKSTQYLYTPENAVKTITDAKGGTTQFDYNTEGLKSITNPLNQITRYTVNGLNYEEIYSPDTGLTKKYRNNAGLLTNLVRADGGTTSFTYDALSRPSTVNASKTGDNQAIRYFYDTYTEASNSATCENGKGRICGIEDNSGRTSYAYYPSGALKRKTQIIEGASFTQTYSYDTLGRLYTVEYPNGMALRYSYNSASQVNLIEARISGTWRNVVGKTDYAYQAADGYSKSIFTYGSGHKMVLGLVDGMVKSVKDGDWVATQYTYNPSTGTGTVPNPQTGGKPLIIEADANAQMERSKTYVDGGQTGTSGYSYVDTFTYDANGNRKSHTRGGGYFGSNTWTGETDTYNYTPGTNRLSTITGPRAKSFSYDANGNVLQKTGYGGNFTFSYDALNRLKSANTTNYKYNFANLRTYKTGPDGTYRYLYNGAGQLIAETQNGTVNLDSIYVYWNERPIAMIRNNQVYSIITDHLGRPNAVVDASRQTAWTASNAPFDRVSTNAITIGAFNIGYPGQYFDKETGLWYNWNRYFDGSIGRYTQSDPIGLAGGLNTYSYVGNSPIGFFDPNGLWTVNGGWGANVTLGQGGGVEGGLYFTTGGDEGCASAGAYGTASKTTGFGAGGGWSVGFYKGGLGTFNGSSKSDTVCILGGCMTRFTNSAGQWIGVGLSGGGDSGGGTMPGGSFTHGENYTGSIPLVGGP